MADPGTPEPADPADDDPVDPVDPVEPVPAVSWADRRGDRAQAAPDLPDWTAIGRGLVGACPRCGGRGIFASMVDLREHCPTCGMHFERESGYWLGAMAVITGVFMLVFAVVSVGGILLFWPDVPWVGLTVAGLVVNGAIPVLGYGWAKTAWMGIEQGFHPPSAAEEADAITRLASHPDPE